MKWRRDLNKVLYRCDQEYSIFDDAAFTHRSKSINRYEYLFPFEDRFGIASPTCVADIAVQESVI